VDVRTHNREVWNRQVEWGNTWTIPVSPQEIAAARRGEWAIVMTPTKPVPRTWFPPLEGCDVLCLASGGGQQGPILAAAGANVTVYDNSPRQLAQDRLVAEREGLVLRTVEGDMRDLSAFADACFDLIVHPVSNCFVPDILPVWREAYRVLRTGGTMIAGFNNPAKYIFDWRRYDRDGVLEVKYALPYADTEALFQEEKRELYDQGEFLEFSHALETQIGGQIEVGRAMIAYGFDRMGIARIVNGTRGENQRSIALMRRLGFELRRNLAPNPSGGNSSMLSVVGILERRR
jgi:SAM-dependent methyltransferase